MPTDLFIIGASTRALADSAYRLGLQATCLDQYTDADLTRKAHQVKQLTFDESGRLLLAAESFRDIVGQAPWIYTGPLENQPEWLAEAAEGTRLYGITAKVVRQVRDLHAMSAWLRAASSPFAVPEMRPIHNRPKRLAGWLWKTENSSGGWSVVKARTKFTWHNGSAEPESAYWQERIIGPAYGATIASDGRNAVVIGTCRSLHGAPGRPFAYAGSSGPERSAHLRRLENILGELAGGMARSFGLRGLWNMDVVYEPRHDRWFLLEINPRPSASMEVLELAARQSLLEIHLAVFRDSGDGWLERANELKNRLAQTRHQVTKRIVYAWRNRRFSRHNLPDVCMEPWPRQTFFADIPHPGTCIPAGYPVMTRIEFPMKSP